MFRQAIVIAGLSLATVAPTAVIAEDKKLSYDQVAREFDTDGQAFRILPREVVAKLDIREAPISKAIPLLIGHYWRCEDVSVGFSGSEETVNSCRLKLVVCTDDGEVCTEH